MLQWLSGLGKRPDHPMYDAAQAARLLADLPGEPRRALEEITSWLEGVSATPGFAVSDRVAVVKLLDESGRTPRGAVLAEFLHNERLREFDRLQLWKALAAHAEQLSGAYRLCLKEIEAARKPGAPAHPEQAVLLARALRALGEEAKTQHLRYYEVAPRIWQELAVLYAQAETERIAAEVIRPYPSEPLPSNLRQEFLRPLMLEMCAPDSQSEAAIELISRIAARLAPGFVLQPQPAPGCPFCFDLSRPARPARGPVPAAAGPALRYFGMGRAAEEIREVIERHTAHPEEPEKRFGEDFPTQEKLVVLKRLLEQWGETPPKRAGPRVPIDAPIRLARGFQAAAELVTRVELAGAAELTADQRLKVKQQTGIALQAQEATAEVREWHERDGGAWGIGVDVPRGDELWARIGALLVFQAPGHKSWWLGAIRRMHRDAEERLHAGIEILAKRPLSVYFRGIGEGATRADHWQTSSGSFEFTFVNAIVLVEGPQAGAPHEVLLAREGFAPGLTYEVMMGEQAPYVRLEELLERGEDYDRVRVSWLKRAV